MDLSRLKNKKILIVEDDPINCELIKEIFDGLEVVMHSVFSGDEAIKACKQSHFDLVLMDIQLPGKNGYEATKEIISFKPNLPIIAQTAYAFEADKLKSKSAGCIDYIAKPFKKDELLSLVLQYL